MISDRAIRLTLLLAQRRAERALRLEEKRAAKRTDFGRQAVTTRRNPS